MRRRTARAGCGLGRCRGLIHDFQNAVVAPVEQHSGSSSSSTRPWLAGLPTLMPAPALPPVPSLPPQCDIFFARGIAHPETREVSSLSVEEHPESEIVVRCAAPLQLRRGGREARRGGAPRVRRSVMRGGAS